MPWFVYFLNFLNSLFMSNFLNFSLYMRASVFFYECWTITCSQSIQRLFTFLLIFLGYLRFEPFSFSLIYIPMILNETLILYDVFSNVASTKKIIKIIEIKSTTSIFGPHDWDSQLEQNEYMKNVLILLYRHFIWFFFFSKNQFRTLEGYNRSSNCPCLHSNFGPNYLIGMNETR